MENDLKYKTPRILLLILEISYLIADWSGVYVYLVAPAGCDVVNAVPATAEEEQRCIFHLIVLFTSIEGTPLFILSCFRVQTTLDNADNHKLKALGLSTVADVDSFPAEA